MAEFAHSPTIGSWFFQAVVSSSKLDRMAQNARAAHWNKPRATRFRESALIGSTLTLDRDQTHQVLLGGVRVIQGRTSPAPNLQGNGSTTGANGLADMHSGQFFGDPQVLFPTGIGLPPFVERPIAVAQLLGFEIVRTLDGVRWPPFTDPTDPDLSFVSWLGGMDWGAATGEMPDGTTYDVNNLEAVDEWPRCVVERPISTTHTGEAGAVDTTIGLRFRVLLGRTGGVYTWPVQLAWAHPGGFYIHWMAMGPVAAY